LRPVGMSRSYQMDSPWEMMARQVAHLPMYWDFIKVAIVVPDY
jgi:hypothetical protein